MTTSFSPIMASEPGDSRLAQKVLPSRAMSDDLTALVTGLAQRAKEASRVLANASTEQKNAVLRRVAGALRGEAGDHVLKANSKANFISVSSAGATKTKLGSILKNPMSNIP